MAEENARIDGNANEPLADGDALPSRRMRAAVDEVRREGAKVAVIYGVIDAALVALVANLAIRFYPPDWMPEGLPLPSILVRELGLAAATVDTSILVGVVLGALTGAVEVALRMRRPVVEQFEAVNPSVSESLRTARDAAERDANTEMAAALYEDVLERLRGTSSAGLVSTRRVFLTVALVMVVSVASIQVAVLGLDLRDLTGGNGGGPSPANEPDEYDGLQDGDEILGEPEDVTAGDKPLEAEISGQGTGDEEGDSSDSFEGGGLAGAGGVDSQQAGFAGAENIEDAELIREYNLRLRGDTDEESSREDDTSRAVSTPVVTYHDDRNVHA